MLHFSAAPKGPKEESPGQCPGDSIRMRIRPALKGRNKILGHTPVVPLQGVAILNTQSSSQGVALGWHCSAPSGRVSRSATPKLAKGGAGGDAGTLEIENGFLASREGCERTERERAWEDLVTGRAGTTPPNPAFARGGKGRNEIGMKAQLVQDQLFTSPVEDFGRDVARDRSFPEGIEGRGIL
jgi:hypothetical protein